ncbi:hypothetical protein [Sphingomonas sp. 37zxx]|uniref:hypothetical protein n=1 Tax=Sphingomonas sp. 37zxx TaxID=1550073 RepID=UPI0012E009E6|nr:hypothetical protein [Sphingomonas sp. 37zxx]
MPTIGILINPDNSWVDDKGACELYRFKGTPNANNKVGTSTFKFENQGARREFAEARNFIIADLMPTTRRFKEITEIFRIEKHVTAKPAAINDKFCDKALKSSVIAKPF